MTVRIILMKICRKDQMDVKRVRPVASRSRISTTLLNGLETGGWSEAARRASSRRVGIHHLPAIGETGGILPKFGVVSDKISGMGRFLRHPEDAMRELLISSRCRGQKYLLENVSSQGH